MARVLVVEDEAIIASDIEEILHGLGHDVVGSVATGREAIRTAATCAPEVVLMDIRLQGDMDGVEAARRICEGVPVPIIFLTAFADVDTIQRAVRTEPYAYLVKPLDDRELRSAMEIALYRSQVDRTLRERQHWFVTTMRCLADGVIATDPGRRVVFMNPSAERLTGWSAEEASSRDVSSVFRVQARDSITVSIDEVIDQAVAQRSAISIEPRATLVARNGRVVPIDDTVTPIVDDRGTDLGAAVVFRDVSVRQELELQLRMADRLSTIGTLTAGIAHEINNPLACVIGNVDLALRTISEERDALLGSEGLAMLQSELRDALEAARRVHAIVRDLGLFSRSEELKLGPVDVRSALDSAARIALNEIRHRAHLDRSYGDVALVEANEGRLCQVFINLLVNSAQAFDERASHLNTITMTTRQGVAGDVIVEVSDNGPGFPASVLERLFTPFVTTKAAGAGSGLGLSICRRIVESFGGRITVESSSEGSCVRVSLPAFGDVRVPSESVPEDDVVARRRGRVLVVDDDPSVRRSLVRMLGAQHDVVTCEDAPSALERTRAGERYDVILCDLMMPGMSGHEYFDALVRSAPDQADRVIFVTGGVFTPAAREFLSHVTNERLEKPFDVRSVRAAVNRRIQ